MEGEKTQYYLFPQTLGFGEDLFLTISTDHREAFRDENKYIYLLILNDCHVLQ